MALSGHIAVLCGSQSEFDCVFRYVSPSAKERFICISWLADTDKINGYSLDGFIVLDGFYKLQRAESIVAIVQSRVR